ncbi:MAG TPA: nuclease-related domain-containing protein [Candidatus Deferrimicrobium sp.]|nr:nuclease-related domain-containing protein [Candidatus Deferrimicrobium sp.]
MANPSEQHATSKGNKEKGGLFGCFIMGIMVLVLVGGAIQMMVTKPNFKVIFLILILAATSLLLLYQVMRTPGKTQQVRHLKLDYEDSVMMEYLGMEEAFYDDNLDHRLKKSGERGEQQVMHALSWLPEDKFTVFNQIFVSGKGRGQQFDHLVVGHNGIFHIETKNHSGRIVITAEGNWEITRTIGGKARTEGMENPLEQVRRHEIVLKDFLDELLGKHRVQVQEIVVIANPKTTLKGEQYSQFVILKREKLLDFILNYGKPGSITPDNRRRIVAEIEKRNA